MSLLGGLKRRAAERYPGLAAAYHVLRQSREAWNRVSVRTPLGFSFIGPTMMQTGAFEPDETQTIAEELKNATVFVDVGANVGFFMCLACQQARHVIAVEPLVDNLDLLYANIEANRWQDVEVFPVGLGAAPALATIYGTGTAASVRRRWAGVSEAWKRTIPLSTMDILLGGRFAGERLLIKIDVEGAELSVLAGSEVTLRRVPSPAWLVEICLTENFPSGVNPNFRAAFDAFWQHGYQALAVGTDRVVTPEVVDRWVNQGAREFGSINYLFRKPDA